MNQTFIKVKVINLERAKVYLKGERMSKRKDEFECLLSMQDLGKYVGKWIAIVDEKVVSTGNAGKEVFKEARQKHPASTPLILKVPSSTVMLL